eukprot:Gb_33781 [translate_table: standard]
MGPGRSSFPAVLPPAEPQRSRGYHPPPFGRATKKAISLPTFFTLISTSVQKGPKEEHLTGKGSRQHQKTDLRSSIHLLVLRRIRSAHGWPPSGFRRNGKSPPCGASPSLMEQAVGEQLGKEQLSRIINGIIDLELGSTQFNIFGKRRSENKAGGIDIIWPALLTKSIELINNLTRVMPLPHEHYDHATNSGRVTRTTHHSSQQRKSHCQPAGRIDWYWIPSFGVGSPLIG